MRISKCFNETSWPKQRFKQFMRLPARPSRFKEATIDSDSLVRNWELRERVELIQILLEAEPPSGLVSDPVHALNNPPKGVSIK
jgi:hypothetical protein